MAESSANPSILHSLMSHPELFVEMLKQGQTYRVYSYFGRNMPISAEIAMFRPKQVYICRNKTISAEYSVSAEFRFFEMGCFGFRCFGKKSVSVGHYKYLFHPSSLFQSDTCPRELPGQFIRLNGTLGPRCAVTQTQKLQKLVCGVSSHFHSHSKFQGSLDSHRNQIKFISATYSSTAAFSQDSQLTQTERAPH